MRSRPQYSADNEDTRSEVRALEIQRDDLVVAVCAGGGRVLGLLGGGARRVVAIDRAPDQLHQLELKAAAAEVLDRDTYLAWIGVTPCGERLDLYAPLRGSLSRPARRYWDRRPGLVRDGVFWAGRTERGLLAFVRWLRASGRMAWAEGLFELDSPVVQRAVLDAHAADIELGVRWCGRFGHPVIAYLLARDPGFLRSTERSVATYLAERLLAWLRVHPARESFLLWMAYHGGLTPGGPLPDFLTPGGYEAMRKGLGGLELRCADLRQDGVAAAYDQPVKWSLSDVGCWMSERSFDELLLRVSAIGSPRSRICFRNFAARRHIPKRLAGRLRRLDSLCDELDAADRSVFFRIEVAELV